MYQKCLPTMVVAGAALLLIWEVICQTQAGIWAAGPGGFLAGMVEAVEAVVKEELAAQEVEKNLRLIAAAT
jgi:hypothetical protein